MRVTLSTAMSGNIELEEYRELLTRWTREWGIPDLADSIECQWSSRLRKTLGRAYVERRLIRLHIRLQDPRQEPLFREVLCHEAAHIAAFHLFGAAAAGHSQQWRELVETVGFEPRLFHREVITQTEDVSRNGEQHDAVCYEHVCPICHSKRISKRAQPRWRCAPCQDAGLDGELVILSRPTTTEGADA